jgi:2-hydroxy-3-oxopropionate reductase
MGAPMAQRLAAHGYPLRLWNRTHAKAVAIQTDTVVAVKDLSELITGDGWKAEVLITMLDSGPVVLDMVQKILPFLRPGMVLIDMSSTRQDEAKELALRLKEAGVHMLDCPVSGGVIGAEQGTLALMAGGESGVFARMENLLRVFGRPVLVGGHGSGQLAKLCNQLIVGGTIEIVAEALLLAQAGGADLPQCAPLYAVVLQKAGYWRCMVSVCWTGAFYRVAKSEHSTRICRIFLPQQRMRV